MLVYRVLACQPWTCRRLRCAAALIQPPPPLPTPAASRVLRTYTWQDRNFLTTWVSGQCHGGSARLAFGCCLKCGAGRKQGPLLLTALQRCHRHAVCRPTRASRLPPAGLPATCCILQVPVERLHVHIRKLVMAGHKVRRAGGRRGVRAWLPPSPMHAASPCCAAAHCLALMSMLAGGHGSPNIKCAAGNVYHTCPPPTGGRGAPG